jgi:genome maintenance exonuclease 1
MLIKKFDYGSIERTNLNGRRYYCTPDGNRLASVTSILEATKSEEQKQALNAWKQRVGHQQAQQIVTEAASRGTRMHRYLEQYICEDAVKDPGSNPYSKQSHQMAQIIIEKYLQPHVSEFYGSEVNLYYPGLYAGTTDCVALWEGELAIVDFKQTNRPKKQSYIEDYFLQLAAYGMAHNELYGTKIRKGVILMCSQNYEPQYWVVSGLDFEQCENSWAQRVDRFYH